VEAKQGTDFVIPVRPIEQYEAVFDENLMPKPVGSEQHIAPWVEALRALLTNQDVYEEEAGRSRAAALQFVRGLNAADFETLLLSLTPQSESETHLDPNVDPRIAHLSAAKRSLLLQRLRQKK
jgi:hypothetical protein